MRGRKRHIVVDTLGFLLAVLAHPADIQDRPGAVSLLPRLQGVVSRLAILYADSGYAGPMVECMLLGNIAMRLGRKLDWDGPNLTCTNVPEANKFVNKEYRDSWKFDI